MRLRAVSFGVLMISLATSVCAQGGGERPNGPPPEAVTACKGLASAAVCSFVGRQGEKMSGTCFKPPAGGQGKPAGQGEMPLACRPDRRGPALMEKGRQWTAPKVPAANLLSKRRAASTADAFSRLMAVRKGLWRDFRR